MKDTYLMLTFIRMHDLTGRRVNLFRLLHVLHNVSNTPSLTRV
jgi:hypothetical protein